mgnify:CR=1 FL=1
MPIHVLSVSPEGSISVSIFVDSCTMSPNSDQNTADPSPENTGLGLCAVTFATKQKMQEVYAFKFKKSTEAIASGIGPI